MLLRIAGKLAWGTTKLTVKYVIVPIAISAATAAVVDSVTEKVRANTPQPNGRVDPIIEPEP